MMVAAAPARVFQEKWSRFDTERLGDNNLSESQVYNITIEGQNLEK